MPPSFYSLALSRLHNKSDDELKIRINKFESASSFKKVLYFLDLFDDTHMDYLAAQSILERRNKGSKLISALVTQ